MPAPVSRARSPARGDRSERNSRRRLVLFRSESGSRLLVVRGGHGAEDQHRHRQGLDGAGTWLGTKSHYIGEATKSETTGFVDNDTGYGIFLVYFDRPCEITGRLVIDDEIYDHNIKINAAGTYWISAFKINENTYTLKVTESNDSVSLAIYPE